MEYLVLLCKNNVIHQSNEKKQVTVNMNTMTGRRRKLTIIITRHTNYGINNQISEVPVCMTAK